MNQSNITIDYSRAIKNEKFIDFIRKSNNEILLHVLILGYQQTTKYSGDIVLGKLQSMIETSMNEQMEQMADDINTKHNIICTLLKSQGTAVAEIENYKSADWGDINSYIIKGMGMIQERLTKYESLFQKLEKYETNISKELRSMKMDVINQLTVDKIIMSQRILDSNRAYTTKKVPVVPVDSPLLKPITNLSDVKEKTEFFVNSTRKGREKYIIVKRKRDMVILYDDTISTPEQEFKISYTKRRTELISYNECLKWIKERIVI